MSRHGKGPRPILRRCSGDAWWMPLPASFVQFEVRYESRWLGPRALPPKQGNARGQGQSPTSPHSTEDVTAHGPDKELCS